MPDDLVTTREAAELLGGVDVGLVSRWAREGKITPVKRLTGLRGAMLFARSDIVALAHERAAELEAELRMLRDAVQ